MKVVLCDEILVIEQVGIFVSLFPIGIYSEKLIIEISYSVFYYEDVL